MKRSLLILLSLILFYTVYCFPQQNNAININSNNNRIKIAIWGDSRENLDNATEDIVDVLLNKIKDWNIQIHTGDFTHDGSDKAWKRSLSVKGMDKLFVKDKILLVTSNHEFMFPSGWKNWNNFTSGILPVNSSDSTTHFYAYKLGNVHIICCDAYESNPLTMQKWLDNYLEKVKPGDWIIAAWHNPSYDDITYKDSHNSASRSWLNSLYVHHCSFVFNGHAHIYLRTKPLNPRGGLDLKNGIVHIINGTGGASWESKQNYVDKTAFTPNERSFPCITFLTIEGNKATIQTVDIRKGSNLKIIDEYSVEK